MFCDLGTRRVVNKYLLEAGPACGLLGTHRLGGALGANEGQVGASWAPESHVLCMPPAVTFLWAVTDSTCLTGTWTGHPRDTREAQLGGLELAPAGCW